MIVVGLVVGVCLVCIACCSLIVVCCVCFVFFCAIACRLPFFRGVGGLCCSLFDVRCCWLYVVSCEWFDVVCCCCVLFGVA